MLSSSGVYQGDVVRRDLFVDFNIEDIITECGTNEHCLKIIFTDVMTKLKLIGFVC